MNMSLRLRIHHDTTYTIRQPRWKLYGVLFGKGATTSALSPQAKDGAQAVLSSARHIVQATDDFPTGEDDIQA